MKLTAADLLDTMLLTTRVDVTANLYEPAGHENVAEISLPVAPTPNCPSPEYDVIHVAPLLLDR
ncbi:MAG: hypothetical protein LBC20_05155 [Planctomycetaceae bacterium]|jgi:hypothetical protein|nr:hypothetical protein [Planctomycetaceae bacterium]